MAGGQTLMRARKQKSPSLAGPGTLCLPTALRGPQPQGGRPPLTPRWPPTPPCYSPQLDKKKDRGEIKKKDMILCFCSRKQK